MNPGVSMILSLWIRGDDETFVKDRRDFVAASTSYCVGAGVVDATTAHQYRAMLMKRQRMYLKTHYVSHFLQAQT